MGSLSINTRVWKCIWHSEASTKCKSLAWRACNDELPVKSLLILNGTVKDDTCSLCGKATETATHALLQCEELRHVWFGSPLCVKVESIKVTNLAQWIEECAVILDRKEMGMTCAIMWAIWEERKKWVLEAKEVDYANVYEKAMSSFLQDQVAGPDEWKPPFGSWVKANFCAYTKEDCGTGMGLIFRNSSGKTIASGTKFMENDCFERVIAEALCYSWGLEQSGELGLSDIIFETECKQLFTHWKKAEQGKMNVTDSYLEELVQECKNMTEGTGSSLVLVRRTANKVAQCLATVAPDYGDKIWMGVVPQEASPCLQSDFEAMANPR